MAPRRDTPIAPQSYDQWGPDRSDRKPPEWSPRSFTIWAFVMGMVGVFTLPIVWGGLGITFGMIANSKGDPLGKAAAGFSAAAMTIGLLLAGLLGAFPQGVVLMGPGVWLLLTAATVVWFGIGRFRAPR